MAFHSGIGRYIRGLTRNLVRAEAGLRLTLLVPSGSDERPWQGLDLRLEAFDAPIYTLREQIQGTLRSRTGASRGDLLHFPHYNAPWGLPRRSVVTIHDLTHVDLPRYFDARRVRLASLALERAVRRAGALIAVSNATRDALVRRFPDCAAKVRVIPLGVDDAFHELPRERIDAFRRERGLGRFVLYVGSGRGHKNLAGLSEAFARLAPGGPEGDAPPVRLVVVGDGTVEREDLPPGTRFVSEIEDAELALWYNAADLLCMPSINEGFGLPALEAMACGTPVVASDIAALKELVGDAGRFAPPGEVDALKVVLERMLDDGRLRASLGRRGVERAKEYAWRTAATRTLEVYRAVAGARR